MLRVGRFIRAASTVALTVVFAVGALALVPNKASGKESEKARLISPINLAILIQDDLISQVANEIKRTGEFIRTLPEGSQVMVGYITTGTLQVRQPFTSDLERASDSLRIPISRSSATSFNPYIEVIEGLKKFNSNGSNNKNENVLLLISDGLDDSRGFDSSVLRSIDLERAVKEANKRDVRIYSFYAPSVGLTGRSRLAASFGQSSLNRISRETGGRAFFQGTTGFVSFNPYFERFVEALNRRHYEEP
jgi:hypothetical protein